MERPRKLLVTAGAAVAVVLGAAGIAAATGGVPTPLDDDRPDFRSSVTIDERVARTDAEEDALLAQVATITAEEAAAAATADVAGTAGVPELDEEDGNVVWEVDVTTADGAVWELSIDAGNGEVIARERDDDDDDDDDHDDRRGAPVTTVAPTTTATTPR